MYYDMNITFLNPWFEYLNMRTKHVYDYPTFLYFRSEISNMKQKGQPHHISGGGVIDEL